VARRKNGGRGKAGGSERDKLPAIDAHVGFP
jgi:hypothetical protein